MKLPPERPRVFQDLITLTYERPGCDELPFALCYTRSHTEVKSSKQMSEQVLFFCQARNLRSALMGEPSGNSIITFPPPLLCNYAAPPIDAVRSRRTIKSGP